MPAHTLAHRMFILRTVVRPRCLTQGYPHQAISPLNIQPTRLSTMWTRGEYSHLPNATRHLLLLPLRLQTRRNLSSVWKQCSSPKKRNAAAKAEDAAAKAEDAAAKAKAEAEEAAAKVAAAIAPPPAEKKPPIRFHDAVGRKFNFPFHLCAKWTVSQHHYFF